MKHGLPDYAKCLTKGREIVLARDGKGYWRYAGAWGVKVRVIGDRIFVDEPAGSRMRHANGLELVPATKEEHDTDNGFPRD